MFLQFVYVDDTFCGGIGVRKVGLHFFLTCHDRQRVGGGNSVTEIVAHVVVSLYGF